MEAWKGTMVGEKSGSAASSKRMKLPSYKHVEQTKVDGPTVQAGTASLDEESVDVDLSEVYFLIMHFLSAGPCNRATGQLWNELLQHKLLPRRYHAWYSRTGLPSGDEDDDGSSFPLSYIQVVERNPNIEKNHLVKLLRQQLLASRRAAAALECPNARIPTAADVPTILGLGSFSLLESECNTTEEKVPPLFRQLRWPHWQSDQVHGLTLRELGGGFGRHHRAPSIRAANYAIVKPSVLVDRIQIIKRFRGHRNAVYCAIFDRTGQHIITGSDDRLVKMWSTETGFCLCSCRGHEGDITDLSVSSGNSLVASASNDCTIRVWRLPDGYPVSVLRGHTAAVTAISFSPRQSCEHHLLSSSDDGTCRIWDARDSCVKSRVYMPKVELFNTAGKPSDPLQLTQQAGIQISCCAFNADGSIFVTGSSDRFARVWDARKWNDEITGKPNHELDVLKGHENAVNYVQFSGCAGPVKPFSGESVKDERTAKFKNSWSARDSIVTCSRDGSAIIWIPKLRRKDARYGCWTKAYHLRVPPPPMPPQPPRGGGPRQRLLPTPRGVNMIVWSLDNRFVLAAIMDCRICVWNAIDGSLVHSLNGHTKSTFVVDVHPFNPRVAMSAGYDGRVIVWDIWEGRPVRVYETGDFQIVDGSFSPDGTSIVVSDEVGQIYLLATGKGESQKDAKYDQFFLGDFRPLVRDIQGNVLDQETQLPPHQRNIQDLLCDASMIPYQEPYQSIYQQRRLGALGIDWQPPAVKLAVGFDDVTYFAYDHPNATHQNLPQSPGGTGDDGTMRWVEQPSDADETIDWELDANRHSEDSGSDYSASEESLSLLDDERTASSSDDFAHSTEKEGESKEGSESKESSEGTAPRRSNRNKRKAEEIPRKSSKVRRKPSVEETDEDGTDRRHTRQMQAQVVSCSGRPELQESIRPKRAAAKNAIQMFSHMHTKREDDDDEFASSEHDTSSYSNEKEPESDGHPMSISCSSKQKDSDNDDLREVEDVMVLLEQKVEESPSCRSAHDLGIEKEVEDFEENEKAEIGQQFPESAVKDNPHESDAEQGAYFTRGQNNTMLKEEDNNENFHIGVKDNTFEREVSAELDGSEPEEFIKHQKSHRRLVLKLRNTIVSPENDLLQEIDAPLHRDHPLPNVDQASTCRDHGCKKTRRLVVKPRQATDVISHTPGVVSDRADDVDDSNSMRNLNYEGIVFTREHKRYLGTGKRKYEAEIVGSSKFVKGQQGNGALRDGETFQGELKKPMDGSSTDITLKPANLGEESYCAANNLNDSSLSSPEHLDLSAEEQNSVEELLETKLERQSSPESTYQAIDPKLVSGYQLQNEMIFQSERPTTTRSGTHTRERATDGSLQMRNSKFRWKGTWEQHQIAFDETLKQYDKRKASDLGSPYGMLDSNRSESKYQNAIVRGRRTSIHHKAGKARQLDEPYLLQTNDRDDKASESQRRRRVRQTNVAEESAMQDRVDTEAQTSVTKDTVMDGMKDEHVTGHTESDYIHDSESWSDDSEGVELRGNTDAHSFRHKRRTLGEIELTNNIFLNSSNDIVSKRRVRHMRSVMSQGNREEGSKDIVNKVKEGIEKRGSSRQHAWMDTVSWHDRHNHQEQQVVMEHTDHTAATLTKETELADAQMHGQDEASRKVLRASNRARRDVGKREMAWDRDQRGRAEMPVSGRDKYVRTRKSSAWLLLSDVEEGTRYIPQFGDEVVYLRQGHGEFLESQKFREPGPWRSNQLRAVEPCRVVDLDYTILGDSGDTCCKLTLEFSDCSSELQGQTFSLTLPELTDFPDFIVEKSRYDASIERKWTNRDRCKVWWRSLDGGGEWWEGRVIAVKPKSLDFPDSPWDRLTVQYKTDTSRPLNHSPWELFEPSDTKWEPPHIDKCKRDHLISVLEAAACESEDAYGWRKLKQAAAKSDFINRLPLPLTLDVIKQRLEKNYYRSIRAFYFDIELLASNTVEYFGSGSLMANKLQNFAKDVLEEIAAQ